MEILGFQIQKAKKLGLEPDDGPQLPSFVPPTDDSGASYVTTNGGGYYGAYIDFEGSSKNEFDLITRYREASMYPDCDNAIEEICVEALGADDDEEIVTVNFDDVEVSKTVKLRAEACFEEIKTLLDFEKKGHDIFRRWYIDGRLYYHKIVDEKRIQEGIQELRYIDPRKIKKVRDVTKQRDPITGVEVITNIKEFYQFSDNPIQPKNGYYTQPMTFGVKIDPASVVSVTSGLIDLDKNMVLGHLHKAVKHVNMLKLSEDAMLLFRLSRAPSRRVFYIDTGNLPNQKAEQHLRNTMNKYRNKIMYDASTGEVRDDRKHMSMLEDYWLPRKGSGEGTKIENLDGQDNTNQREDVEYFQKRVYNALNVPLSRLDSQSTLNFGRQSEITNEELKFAKFIARLRRKFSELFDDLLKTEMVLTGVCSAEDWDNLFANKVKYVFSQSIYWKESKDLEVFRNRIDLLTEMQDFVGKYYSMNYVKKNILKQTDEEIEEIQAEIQAEMEDQIQQAEFQGQLELAQQSPMMNAQNPPKKKNTK